MKQNLTGMENIMKTIIELMTDEFKKAFAEYTAAYNADDPKIKLKIDQNYYI